jgi:hypothetical protein
MANATNFNAIRSNASYKILTLKYYASEFRSLIFMSFDRSLYDAAGNSQEGPSYLVLT